MARVFDSSTTRGNIATPITGTPLTLSAWAKPANLTEDHQVFGIFDISPSDSGSGFFIQLSGNSGDKARAMAFSATFGFEVAVSTATYDANEWNHIVGVFLSSDQSRTCYLNGVAGPEKGNFNFPINLDDIVIGAFHDDGGYGSSSGDVMIGETAAWNVVLDDEEIEALAAGVCALSIRPQSLLYYAPTWGGSGTDTNEQDLITGGNLGLTGSPAYSGDHPRIFMPDQQIITFPGAAAPAGARPQNPLGHPFYGPFRGPIS